MKIEQISEDIFDEYASVHMLKSFYQTKEYGQLMKHSEFNVMYIGAFHKGLLVAASLILYKNIGPNMKYGYAPRGFLIDFYDKPLLKAFTKKLKEFFFLKGYAFIKIDPEITYATLDYENKSKIINSRNKELIQDLKELGYDKLRDNLYFENLLPKFTSVINLKNYDFNNLDKKLMDEMEENKLKGINFSLGNENDIELFYSLVKDKNSKTLTYYKYFYESFKHNNMIDIIKLELNYLTYQKYLQKKYAIEENENNKINEEFANNPNDENIYDKKITSDKILNTISSDIAITNQKMQENNTNETLAIAYVIKNQGRITILIAGYKDDFRSINSKSFLFYKIIEEYKKAGYLFFDLNGMTGDFSDENPYKKFNEFKLQFKPTTYEYIGEFDLIINKPFHQILWSTNKIQKEFYKKSEKN